MKTLKIILAALLVSATTSAIADSSADLMQQIAALGITTMDASDQRTLRQVARSHAQLQRWCDTEVERLRRGLMPRPHDPFSDGRAALEIQRLRLTYAANVRSGPLATVIERLANAHEARIFAVRDMANDGVDMLRYAALDQPLTRAATALARSTR